MVAPTGSSFYQSISSFTDFTEVVNDQHYHDVPEDWLILLTDIRGSTKAIEQGRYKQVNMIGAASITCVLNSLKDFSIPFVFGGDGATLLIPSTSVSEISKQLQALQWLSYNEFQIDLRVGLVPLALLKRQNYFLKVAKYELSPGNYLAQFRGNALSRAEELVKSGAKEVQLLTSTAIDGRPDLTGLSCRLNPLPSKNGLILSLICKPRDSSPQLLKEIISQMRGILGADFQGARPVSPDRLHWRWLPQSWKDEARTLKRNHSYWRSLLRTTIWILLSNLSLKLNIPLGPFLPRKYKAELVANTDFRKFDEVLRMVVDCSPSQVAELENLLQDQYRAGKIFFGIHKSKEALMTCMVFSPVENQHLHFVDGAQGGYAFAAIGLKQQMKGAIA